MVWKLKQLNLVYKSKVDHIFHRDLGLWNSIKSPIFDISILRGNFFSPQCCPKVALGENSEDHKIADKFRGVLQKNIYAKPHKLILKLLIFACQKIWDNKISKPDWDFEIWKSCLIEIFASGCVTRSIFKIEGSSFGFSLILMGFKYHVL